MFAGHTGSRDDGADHAFREGTGHRPKLVVKTLAKALHHALVGGWVYEGSKDVLTSDNSAFRMNAKS